MRVYCYKISAQSLFFMLQAVKKARGMEVEDYLHNLRPSYDITSVFMEDFNSTYA